MGSWSEHGLVARIESVHCSWRINNELDHYRDYGPYSAAYITTCWHLYHDISILPIFYPHKYIQLWATPYQVKIALWPSCECSVYGILKGTWNRLMSRGFPAFFRQFWLHFMKNFKKNLQKRKQRLLRLDNELYHRSHESRWEPR